MRSAYSLQISPSASTGEAAEKCANLVLDANNDVSNFILTPAGESLYVCHFDNVQMVKMEVCTGSNGALYVE